MALSTAEAEYISAAEASAQIVWVRGILEDLRLLEKGPTELVCDSTSAIAIAVNPVNHKRTKHIKRRFHFIREQIEEEEIKMVHCSNKYQIADIFTKPLDRDQFEELRRRMGVVSSMEISLQRGC